MKVMLYVHEGNNEKFSGEVDFAVRPMTGESIEPGTIEGIDHPVTITHVMYNKYWTYVLAEESYVAI